MAQPNVAREPSMDEILASIRKIIESNEPGIPGVPRQRSRPARTMPIAAMTTMIRRRYSPDDRRRGSRTGVRSGGAEEFCANHAVRRPRCWSRCRKRSARVEDATGVTAPSITRRHDLAARIAAAYVACRCRSPRAALPRSGIRQPLRDAGKPDCRITGRASDNPTVTIAHGAHAIASDMPRRHAGQPHQCRQLPMARPVAARTSALRRSNRP